jgi:hypothetical protein
MPKLPKVPKMPKVEDYYRLYLFFLPIEVKMANNSLHSVCSADTCSVVFHPTSIINFNQNWVSLASLSQIAILFF